LNNSSHVVTAANFLITDDFGVGAALASLTTIQMGDSSLTNRISSSIIIAITFLGVACDHTGLSACTCVASVGVDPRETDFVLLTIVTEAVADLVLTLNLSTLHACASVAVIHV